MKSKSTHFQLLPILLGFFVMGFCDIVGISSDYVQKTFNWSDTMTGFVPSMVFIWFLFLGIPIGNKMSQWGRKNTVLLSFGITVIGMFLPLVSYNGAICLVAFALLGMGNTILQKCTYEPEIPGKRADGRTSGEGTVLTRRSGDRIARPALFRRRILVLLLSHTGHNHPDLRDMTDVCPHREGAGYGKEGFRERNLGDSERQNHPAVILRHLLHRRL